MKLNKKIIREKNRLREIEDSLKLECLDSIEERAKRYLSIRRLPFIPHTYFASISSEVLKLYRDGYFFACVALSQSVAEALSRFLCKKSRIRSRGNH